MFIQHITIENFGAICSYDIDLAQKLNLIDSRYADEILTAIRFLLCNKPQPAIPERWLCDDTRILAKIRLTETSYSVCAKTQLGQLQLFATDPAGTDVTAQYQYALSHCKEQDDIELFDGQDNETHLCLHRYYCRGENPDLSGRTRRVADTKTFRRYLYQYIRSFCPEPINCTKNYQVTINTRGVFEVQRPGVLGRINLSETEEKLFRYTCFLNVAEFWADIEKIRDLHHEKKPLVIRNFLEFLDESTDIGNLIDRTVRLQRQVIILAPPPSEEVKKIWTERMVLMGYFSNLAIDYMPCDQDYSYTTPEMQLLWRLEDLQVRLEELSISNRVHESRETFSREELRYVLPERFSTISDTRAAIELAIDELLDRYGIRVREETKEEPPEQDEITGMQISFLDILSACALSAA